MVEVMKIMVTSFKRSPAHTAALSARPCSRPPLTNTFAGHSWTLLGKSGSISCGVTASLPWVLVHKFLLVPSKSLFPSPVYVLAALLWG